MKLFKPEDFDVKTQFDDLPKYVREAVIANDKLEREGKVVYGSDNQATWTNHWSNHESEKWKTQKALLINLEPIENLEMLPDWDSLKINCKTLQELADLVAPYRSGQQKTDSFLKEKPSYEELEKEIFILKTKIEMDEAYKRIRQNLAKVDLENE